MDDECHVRSRRERCAQLPRRPAFPTVIHVQRRHRLSRTRSSSPWLNGLFIISISCLIYFPSVVSATPIQTAHRITLLEEQTLLTSAWVGSTRYSDPRGRHTHPRTLLFESFACDSRESHHDIKLSSSVVIVEMRYNRRSAPTATRVPLAKFGASALHDRRQGSDYIALRDRLFNIHTDRNARIPETTTQERITHVARSKLLPPPRPVLYRHKRLPLLVHLDDGGDGGALLLLQLQRTARFGRPPRQCPVRGEHRSLRVGPGSGSRRRSLRLKSWQVAQAQCGVLRFTRRRVVAFRTPPLPRANGAWGLRFV